MNIRDLKKDITFLANDIAMTIVINNSIKADNTEKASELMVKVAVFKSEFTKKANQKVEKDKKARKAYYTQLRKELYEQFSSLAEEAANL
jgi:hypothetical protein